MGCHLSKAMHWEFRSKVLKKVFLSRIISLSQKEDTVKISRTRIHPLFTVRVELYQQDSLLQNSGKRLRGVICRQVATCSAKMWRILLVKANGESGYWVSNQQSQCRELEQSLPVKPDLAQTFVCVSSPYSCANVPGFDLFLAAYFSLCIPLCILELNSSIQLCELESDPPNACLKTF